MVTFSKYHISSYLTVAVAGYSVSVGQKNDAPLYFAGAPRFEHRGQVVLFRYNGDWIPAQRLDGDQVGNCLEMGTDLIIHTLYTEIYSRFYKEAYFK